LTKPTAARNLSWVSDTTTPELQADLQAQLEWLESNPRDVRAASVRRKIRALEHELKARGEKLEPLPK
jgi:hypothetical protein